MMVRELDISYYVFRRATAVVRHCVGVEGGLGTSWLVYDVIVFTDILQDFLPFMGFFFPTIHVVARLLIL